MDNQSIGDRLLSLGLWPLCAAILFMVFAIRGDNAPALLMAVSGVAALPVLSDMFREQGAGERLQFRVSAGTATAACLLAVANAAGIFDSPETRSTEPSSTVSAADGYSTSNGLADQQSMGFAASPSTMVTNCYAIDGDTLDCSGERIRLIGIDAPEMPGHCQGDRDCVQGDPFASKASLQGLVQPQMAVIRIGADKYGRTLAMIYSQGSSLSCNQLALRQAAYVSDWDNEGLVATECLGQAF